jgi:hypothetical protein
MLTHLHNIQFPFVFCLCRCGFKPEVNILELEVKADIQGLVVDKLVAN